MATTITQVERLLASSQDAGSTQPLHTLIVDGTGAPASVGGSTQYTEGDTDTTITGTAVMFESNTGTSTLSVVNASTPLPVVQTGAFPAGSNVIGHVVVDNTSTTAVTQATASNLNATVVGTGTFATQATLQTQTDTVMVGGVNVKEINAVAPLMGAGNTGTGSLRVTIATDQAQLTNKLLVTPDANSAINLAQVGGTNTVSGGVNGSQSVGGPTASGSSIAANPVTIGTRAATAPPTAVANAQVVNAQANIYGELIVRHALRETKGNQQTTITSSTGETTIVTADATYKLDLYGLVLANSSGTATKVTIKDSTAGTTRFVFMIPAGEDRGFMLPASDGHKQAAANNNWTATCGTSVASVDITALFVQNL